MENKNQQEMEYDKRYPTKEYNKTIFVFTAEELRKLASLESIAQMGQIATVMINNIVQGECLPRVGIKDSPDIGVLYNIPSGQFYTYVPKFWCMRCKIRKATFEYKGISYCQSCVSIIQNQEKLNTKESKKK